MSDEVKAAAERWKAHDWSGPNRQYGLPDQAYKDMLTLSDAYSAAAERANKLEHALRSLVSACKTSGRLVGFYSDVVDYAEAALTERPQP